MTVPGELEQAYNQLWPALQRLKEKCDPLLKGVARSVGGSFLDSRIKPTESVLQKIEKDGPAKPFQEIDDLFAATIVVPNETLIPQVETEVCRLFEIVEAAPPRTKKPQEFIYDDRHVILKLRPEPGREDPELDSIRFELQIKTPLQVAASSVSRGLEYKTQWMSWTRARLASRIRAMVETADDLLVRLAESLQEPEKLPEEQYTRFATLNQILDVLEQVLASEQIPQDRRRLAITIEQLLRQCKPRMSLENLKEVLTKPEYARVREAYSISAAGSVFIVLFLEGRLSVQPGDPNSLRGSRRYLITTEMVDLCPTLGKIPQERRVDLTPAMRTP